MSRSPSAVRPDRLTAVLGPPPRSGPRPPGAGSAGRTDTDEPPTVPLPLGGGAVVDGAAPPGGGGRAPRSIVDRLVPARWSAARLDPGRPGATALALVAAAAAVLAAVGVWTERPRAEPVDGLTAVSTIAEAPSDPTGAPGAPAAPTASTPAPPAAPLVVSVSGRVQRPGLVEVPDGARVADVLRAAGGALPGTDLTALNLARKVGDGEQVAVGVPAAPDAGPAPAAPGTGGAAGSAAGGGASGAKVDLNAATSAQLDTLPGVGPVTAERIVEWRTRNGRFARVEQLREIEGIGERRFGQLRELVTV